MNRRIIMSGLSIVTTLVMLGGSAFAAFTTTAVATNNTFSATTPSLTLQVDAAGPDAQSVPGITVTGLIPGGPSSDHTFAVRNTDADTGATQAITLNFDNNPSSTLPGSDTTIVVDCGQGAVSDTYSGWMTGHFIGNVGPTAVLTCSFKVTLNAGVPNSDAGLQDAFNAVFTGSLGL